MAHNETRVESTVHPDGPVAQALRLLADFGAHDCVEAVRAMWMERIDYREQVASADAKLNEILAIIQRPT